MARSDEYQQHRRGTRAAAIDRRDQSADAEGSRTETQRAKKGSQKVCYPTAEEVLVVFKSEYRKVRIGAKDDAKHPGGISIFDRGFGNYDQDIVLRISTG